MENIKFEKENLLNIFKDITKNNFDNLSKISEISKKSKILYLEIISSCFEPKGLKLKINPYGYENSLRKENDGVTYFGYEEQSENVIIYILLQIIFLLCLAIYRLFDKTKRRKN